MDDSGLLKKPQDDKPDDKPAGDDQKKIDDVVNQLPAATPSEPVKSPVSFTPPPPSSSVSPPPVSPPPVPPVPPVTPPVTTPPVADDSGSVSPEEPKTEKPKRKIGKNVKKAVGGVLVVALLVGGVFVGRGLIEKETRVEPEAVAGGTAWPCRERAKNECGGCIAEGVACKWIRKDKVCRERQVSGCEAGSLQTGILNMVIGPNCPEGCSLGDWNHWVDDKCVANEKCEIWIRHCSGTGCANYGVQQVRYSTCAADPSCRQQQEETHLECDETTFACVSVAGAGTDECATDDDCQEETHLECDETTFTCVPVAGAGTDECATDPDCVTPEFSCVDLSSDPAAIEYEDIVTFTCEADFSALNPVAFFRYSVDGGSYTVSSAVVVDTISNTASYDIAVNEYGEWEVECRVCEDDTVTSSCTSWGQAN